MLRIIFEKHQIFNSIIGFDSVYVMDYLAWFKKSSKMSLHYKSVFLRIFWPTLSFFKRKKNSSIAIINENSFFSSYRKPNVVAFSGASFLSLFVAWNIFQRLRTNFAFEHVFSPINHCTITTNWR